MTTYESTKSTKIQKYKTEKYKNTKTDKMQICKKMQKCEYLKAHKNAQKNTQAPAINTKNKKEQKTQKQKRTKNAKTQKE